MKKLQVLVPALLCLFLLSSCSKENVNAPLQNETVLTKGKVSLTLDKVNAPSDVAKVTACLTRPDCESLVKSLSMYGDSTSAEIVFEGIKTGLWHLRIAAQSSAGDTLYTGETDVQVLDSKTTEVQLTLTPKPTGMGSVYINVKWGKTGWVDYANNPIFTRIDALNNPYGGTSSAKVLFENGKYRMWYSHVYESAHGDIHYAESIDGLHWHNVQKEAVLAPGDSGNWDSYMVGISAIMKDEQGYKMYYAGCSSHNNVQNVGLAFSNDGIHWQKHSKPVFTSSAYETGIIATGVVKNNGLYYMYFSSSSLKIGVAVSQDGISWERNGTPALEPSQGWEESGIVYPTVIHDGAKFIMVYKNWDRSAFGMATSTDGIHWTKDAKNPVFEASNTSRHWTNSINYPWLLYCNRQLKIYYTGVANGEFNLALLTKSAI